MKKPAKKLTQDQRRFVIEVILEAALDRIMVGLPDTMAWKDRRALYCRADNPAYLSDYEAGAVDMAGMALAVFYAQLTWTRTGEEA